MLEHKTISLAEQVFEHLENNILTGKYQRGEVLTEQILVTDLGVSRTPVREALHRLEQEHIIEITSKGILILGVTEQDLEDIFAIRMRIEGLASYSAAQKMTPEQLAAHDASMKELCIGGEMGDPIKDFLPVMAFAASDSSRFMTGQTISVDGGIMMVR